MKTLSKIILAILVMAALLGVGTFAYMLSFYSQTTTSQYDCAVVFGAAVWPGGNPSHALADRTYSAITVYKNGQVSCLIFSGADSVYGKHEVDVMLDIAYAEGVEFEDIELDYDGTNTRQTIRNLSSGRSYLLVSSDFHLARINLLARKVGLEKYAVYPSAYRSGRYTRESFFVMREMAAFWYYALGG